MSKSEDRFPYEKSQWAGTPIESKAWFEALERTGTATVRMKLAQSDSGSRGAISVSSVTSMTKGFAEEWLAWRDQQVASREASFRSWQIFWTRWAALAATVAALATAIGWLYTIAMKGN